MSELRFTDKPPPPAVLDRVFNWVHAYGEEGRKGQDETTIKPQRRQDRIDDETAYTTVDVWLASEETCVGLLWLSAGQPNAIEVYEGDVVWCVRRDAASGVWQMDEFRNPTGVGLADPSRFPLRFFSRLLHNKRPLKGIIGPDGKLVDWIIEDW